MGNLLLKLEPYIKMQGKIENFATLENLIILIKLRKLSNCLRPAPPPAHDRLLVDSCQQKQYTLVKGTLANFSKIQGSIFEFDWGITMFFLDHSFSLQDFSVFFEKRSFGILYMAFGHSLWLIDGPRGAPQEGSPQKGTFWGTKNALE